MLVNIGTRVVTEVFLAFSYFVYHHGTFYPGVSGDLAKWFLDSAFDDLDTGRLVLVLAFQFFKSGDSTDVCNTTSGNDTFLDSGTRCAQCIVDAIFLLLHLDFRSGTHVKNGNSSG